MKLLEYEAKQLLKTFGVPIPQSIVVKLGQLDNISFPIVLKSQVLVGGRGKAGGVVIISTPEEYESQKEKLFQLPIKGFLPKALLAEEVIDIQEEYYLSLLVDRATASIRLIAHNNGGTEVENNNAFFNEEITSETLENVVAAVASFLKHDKSQLTPFVTKLYEAFIKSDAVLLEINPLIATKKDELVCGDCKLELDDAAGFRHPEWDFEDKPKDTNFVVLDKNGNVATIANGAGLAMATVDAVAARGMTPANFLDIGGGATTESVLNAFTKIQEFPHIQAIIINIFAGITRCDQIAKAVIEAKKQFTSLPPIFIRLAGTNFEEAVALLAAEDIPTLGTLEDCLDAAREVAHG